MSPKDVVLLYCARTNMDEKVVYKVKEALSSGLENSDWDYIILNALQHGISPLLYHNLSKIDDANLVPERIREHLRGQYYTTLTRNMLYYNELSKVLQSFKDAGIEAIVLKGAALAEAVYGDIGLRPFGDVDFLVHEFDLQKAKQKLSELGFILDEQVSPMEHNEKFGCDLNYVKNSYVFEIHWHIARKTGSDRFVKIEIDRMWKNALPARIAGVDTFVLSPEDLLFHLCIHLPKHRYNRLIWLCDIMEVIRHDDINWEYVLKNAKKYRAKAIMYYGLHFANELLGCGGSDIPSNVLSELKPPRFETIVFNSILDEILSNKRNVLPIFNLMRPLLIDRTQDRFKYLLEYIFPPVELLAHGYSVPESKKIYFYYLIHPIYLWVESIKRFMSFITK